MKPRDKRARTVIHTFQHHRGGAKALLRKYHYQGELTRYLDSLQGKLFSQDAANQITLWKVNRYARIPANTRRALHQLARLEPKQHRKGDNVLRCLISCTGVDLPMASTFLRFQAPDIFQIIDRRAYRATYGKNYPLYGTSNLEKKVSTYFEYLDRLHELAECKRVPFRELDRILYVFDKIRNKTL